MPFLRLLTVSVAVSATLALPAVAGPAPSAHGGGSTDTMGRFALAISDGTGHFECLMPSLMNVQATVTGVDASSATSVSFHGTASVTLAEHNPFGLPAGPLTRDASFVATAVAGGPGAGQLDLKILGLDFPGTVEHGQITLTP